MASTANMNGDNGAMDAGSWDDIVLGAGTAGCLLANRLSADPQRRVLLVEAGPTDRYHWIHIPVGYLYCIGNPRTDWCYRTEADAGLNGRSLGYPRGRTLGGCSSINGMIYMRGQSRDYDQWARLTGDDAWSWANVLPDFIRHEDYHGGASTLHGSGGEWRIEKQRLQWDILDAFAKAATEAGIPASADFNRGNNEGVGYFEVNQRAGWRWSAARAFLNPVKSRPNLTVMTKAQVVRLLTEAGDDGRIRCTGAVLATDLGQIHVRARGETILAAGSIGSPSILQRSGIGPASLLARHQIPVIADLPGVGANLQDHLQIRAVFKVRGTRTLNALAGTLIGKASIGFEYLFKRSGPMSMAPSQLGAFTRSDPGREWPNIQYHVQPLSLDAFGQPLHPFPAITASVCNLNPESRGHVHIRSPRFDDAPLIAPNYLSTDGDRKVAADSLRVTRKIAAQPAMARFAPEEYKPGTRFQTDDELARLAGDIATTIFHPVGTTKMGRTDGPDADPMAVVDSRLRVRGIAGLRVIDAGVMPTITSGNTNSPTLMIAEKAAGWVLADRQAPGLV